MPLPAAADAVQTLVVTATRGALPALDAPASLSLITAQDIAARGADNALEAMRGEVGLSLQGRAVGGRKVLGLRGLDSRHTLVLVDGQRLGASDGVIGASDFAYDWVAVEDIQRIEIVRGPLSVLYGSEALGGVVNIITRETGDTWRFGARAEGSRASGSRGGDGERAALRADGPLASLLGGTLTLRAGASRSRLDAVASVADPRISELEGRDKEDAWFGLGWRDPSGNRLRLEHHTGREQRDADARERGGKRRYHHSINDIERSVTSLGWDGEFARGGGAAPLVTQLRAYRSTIAVVNLRTEGVTVNTPQRIEERVLEGQARVPLQRQTWTAGFELRNDSLADPGLPGGESLARHRALYLQDEASLSRDLTLSAGLRHDRHAQYGSHWSPRAYLVWRASQQWTIKGGASHGFMAPNQKQIVPGTRAEGPNLFVGNPLLTPEKSNSVEAGVTYDAGGTQAQLTLFDQRVRDLIDIRLVAAGSTPGTGTYTYDNLAEARLSGLEASWTLPLTAAWQASLHYTYLDAKSGSGQRLERRPRHSATLNLGWTQGPWRSGVRIEHSGRQLLPSTTVGAPAALAPDVTLTSAFIARDLGHGVEATLGVNNLDNLRLAAKSPLFTQAEAPRTWRFTLRGQW